MPARVRFIMVCAPNRSSDVNGRKRAARQIGVSKEGCDWWSHSTLVLSGTQIAPGS